MEGECASFPSFSIDPGREGELSEANEASCKYTTRNGRQASVIGAELFAHYPRPASRLWFRLVLFRGQAKRKPSACIVSPFCALEHFQWPPLAVYPLVSLSGFRPARSECGLTRGELASKGRSSCRQRGIRPLVAFSKASPRLRAAYDLALLFTRNRHFAGHCS